MKTITYNPETHRLVPVDMLDDARVIFCSDSEPNKNGDCSDVIEWFKASIYAAQQPEPVEVEPVACSLPERDTSKTVEQQGLFRKFIIERVDGSDKPGGKHFGCEYFVLDMHHDKHAVDALRAYATSCKHTHPELSEDLFSRFGTNTAPPDYEEIKRQRDELAAAHKELDLRAGKVLVEELSKNNERIKDLEKQRDELVKALESIIVAANDSDESCYGTLATRFVRGIAEPALASVKGESND